ncbi:hypothetical protein J437_LFUL012613 [Ladona fulva]|uniref:Alpha-soluble NSF attachment protein n=1 Tax=Ladona fulva TaxID=123851 RepID=A0A8K0P545_LADFU|nr:hypothetical protein J437_LFUL012613 [Ladona fulva]
MGDNEQKAMQLMAEAEKKLHSSKGFFGALFGGSAKVDDAIECYQRAANTFKMAKNWGSAGNAFCEAAGLHAKAGSRHDAATSFVDAANCYKKSDPKDAVICLMKAIEIYTDMGRFTLAAKHHQSIAELYEAGDCGGGGSGGGGADLERAISHYEQAADYFRGEESNSSANKCLLKVAQYAAQLEKYDKAVQIYEQWEMHSTVMKVIPVRGCVTSLVIFCYICGEWTGKTQQKNIRDFVKRVFAHLKLKLENQEKAWAPHKICRRCTEDLCMWYKGRRTFLFCHPSDLV